MTAIAERLLAAIDSGTQIAPISSGDPAFDIAAAYGVLEELHARRRAQGFTPVGRKVGFTNRTILARYGVDRPMWSYVWDRTLTMAPSGEAELALDGLMEPRIEPEVVFKLRAPLPTGNDPVALLQAVEWVAAGFEIVHSVFLEWKFTAADCTSALGLHGALVVGMPVAVDDIDRATLAAAMPTFTATLRRDGSVVDRGTGANVLGSPVNVLAHLRDVLATQARSQPLAAGEIITTGTITDAAPAFPGETWTSDYGILGIRGLRLRLR